MRNNLIIFVSLLLSVITFAGTLDKGWYELPEEGMSKIAKQSELNLDSVEDDLDTIYTLNQTALNSVKKNKSKWSLKGMWTTLALGLSGKIGLHSVGGVKAVNIIWVKKNKEQKKEEVQESAHVITANEFTTEQDLENQANVLSEVLFNTGKINNKKIFRVNLKEKLVKFSKIITGLKATKNNKFYPGRLWFDFKVAVTGNIMGYTVGGGTLVKLEYERIMAANTVENETREVALNNENSQIQNFFQNLAEDISTASEEYEKTSKLNYKFARFKVALGLTAKGSIGILKGTALFAPHVFFFPNPNYVKKGIL